MYCIYSFLLAFMIHSISPALLGGWDSTRSFQVLLFFNNNKKKLNLISALNQSGSRSACWIELDFKTISERFNFQSSFLKLVRKDLINNSQYHVKKVKKIILIRLNN